MTFKDYWTLTLEELSRMQILKMREAIAEIIQYIDSKQIERAVVAYKQLLKTRHDEVNQFLSSGDHAAEDFVNVALPKILNYSQPKERSSVKIKKQEADVDLLQSLRYVNKSFSEKKYRKIFEFLDSIREEDPDAYSNFIEFAKSYDQHAGKIFRSVVFPRLLEMFPQLAVVKPKEDHQ
jgi:hypothetical protein